MKNFILIISILSGSFLYAQSFHSKKPDFKKISTKAEINFKKARLEGKTFKNEKIIHTKNSVNNNILNYTQIPSDARIPGQFEENQAIAMTWSYNYDFETNTLNVDVNDTEYGKISADLAVAVQQGAKVLIRVASIQDSTAVKDFMVNRGTPLTNYSFYVHPIESWWDRDSGPISFYYGEQDNIGMIDMDYYTFEAMVDSNDNVSTDFAAINEGGRLNDDLIPVALSQKLGYQLYKTSLNDEGGNIISDGLGRFIGSDRTRSNNTQTSSFGDPDFTYYPNYPLPTQEEYNGLFLNSFKLNNNIETQAFTCDGGTGHIDIFGKLIDENNFLLADYSAAINHTDFEKWNANLQLLQNLQDSNNKKLTIKLVPMPRLRNGDIQTSCDELDQLTYVNGVFVNKNYIMPVQSPVDNLSTPDSEAITAFKNALPGYNVIPVDASIMYGSGGSLHCITMQIPAENPVFIQHNAITGKQLLEPFVINAVIKNKSGLATQFVYYRKSTSTDWIALPMTSLESNNYTATIPTTGLAIGDEIHYFIEATSNNGKTISKPFVAREGGFNKFIITNNLSVSGFDATTNFVLNAYPNPSNGSFTLPVSVDDTRNVNVEVFDLLGRNVFTENSEVEKGIHLKNITLTNTSGVYIVKTIIDGTITKTQRLVIR